MQQGVDRMYFMYFRKEEEQELMGFIERFLSEMTEWDIEEIKEEGEYFSSAIYTRTKKYLAFNTLVPYEQMEAFLSYGTDGRKKGTKVVIWGVENEDDTFSDTAEMIRQYER